MSLTKFCDPMGAFRKRKVKSQFDLGSCEINTTIVTTKKEVDINGSPNVVVETKKVNIEKYAESLGLPKSEEYTLEAMLRSGHVPEEVPVSGLLDNPDPTAIENYNKAGEMFEKLQEMEPSPEPAPVAVTPDPEPKTE